MHRFLLSAFLSALLALPAGAYVDENSWYQCTVVRAGASSADVRCLNERYSGQLVRNRDLFTGVVVCRQPSGCKEFVAITVPGTTNDGETLMCLVFGGTLLCEAPRR